MRKLTLASLLAIVILGAPMFVQAQDKPATPAPAAPTLPKRNPNSLPFIGKLGAIDKTAKTITLDQTTKRVFQVTSETKIMKDDKPATLEDGVIGERVAGSYKKGEDGKLNAISVYFGTHQAGGAKKKKEPAPETK